MKRVSPSFLLFAGIALAYLVYAAFFILRTSFVVNGERFFVLFDDMMISMRYAKNLAQGYGLVWNAGGEHVEGFTNLLWTLYMSLIHFLPLPPAQISLLVQITGAVCVVGTLFLVQKIAAIFSPSYFLAGGAMVLTAFYLPLNNWALLGTEVSVLTLLYCLAIYLLLESLKAGRSARLPFIILGIATLVRVDMVSAYLGVLGLMLVLDRGHWRTNLTWGLGLLALFVIPQTLFRSWYYGDVLPNTYYLKMTGFPELLRLGRGAYVAGLFAWGAVSVVALAVAAVLMRRDRLILFLGGAVCVPIAYSIYVGGDAWEFFGGSNRYITIAIPLLFVMAMLTLTRIVEWLWNKDTVLRRGLAIAGAAVALVAMMLMLNRTDRPEPWAMWLLTEPAYGVGQNRGQVRLAQDLQRVTTPEARIAVVLAGALPYFTDRYVIDLLGKSDQKIAHEPMHVRDTANWLHVFYPGHQKWDYEYSIDELKPDVVARLWRQSKAATVKRLTPTYVETKLSQVVYLRGGSDKILWDEVEAAQP